MTMLADRPVATEAAPGQTSSKRIVLDEARMSSRKTTRKAVSPKLLSLVITIRKTESPFVPLSCTSGRDSIVTLLLSGTVTPVVPVVFARVWITPS